MSAKQSADTSSETSSVVVGDNKQGSGFSNKRVKLAVIVAGALLVIAGGWALYQNRKTAHEKQEAAKLVIQKQSVQDTKDDAGVKAFSGDTDGAIQDLETKLSSTTNKGDRANIYNQIALIYAGKKQIDKAVAASELATKEDPTYVRYATTALIYENAGNKAKAAEYYQKAVNAYNPNDSLNQSIYPKGVNPDVEQYKKKIKELQG